MKLNYLIFITVLFFISKFSFAGDCKSFQESLNIQNELIEYVSCEINHEKQGVPIELIYRFKGINALDVERYLIDEFDINSIEREPGHPFWNSYKNYPPQRNLQILIGTEENLYDRTRADWKNIDYFYIRFSKFTEDI